MKRAAVDPDRTAGAAVLRRVDEPTEKEPSQSPQMQLDTNDKTAGAVSGALETHNPSNSLQHGAQPGKFICWYYLLNALMSSSYLEVHHTLTLFPSISKICFFQAPPKLVPPNGLTMKNASSSNTCA